MVLDVSRGTQEWLLNFSHWLSIINVFCLFFFFLFRLVSSSLSFCVRVRQLFVLYSKIYSPRCWELRNDFRNRMGKTFRQAHTWRVYQTFQHLSYSEKEVMAKGDNEVVGLGWENSHFQHAMFGLGKHINRRPGSFFSDGIHERKKYRG